MAFKCPLFDFYYSEESTGKSMVIFRGRDFNSLCWDVRFSRVRYDAGLVYSKRRGMRRSALSLGEREKMRVSGSIVMQWERIRWSFARVRKKDWPQVREKEGVYDREGHDTARVVRGHPSPLLAPHPWFDTVPLASPLRPCCCCSAPTPPLPAGLHAYGHTTCPALWGHHPVPPPVRLSCGEVEGTRPPRYRVPLPILHPGAWNCIGNPWRYLAAYWPPSMPLSSVHWWYMHRITGNSESKLT